MKGPAALGRWGARLARDLTGRSGERLLDQLHQQLACTARGARLVRQLTAGEVTVDEAHESMRELEHEGDEARARLVAELGVVLATPVDAEDLFRVSRSIDDILDNLRDFTREVDLFRAADLSFADPLTEALQDGLECLDLAVLRLREPREDPRAATLDTQKATGEMRRSYQHQLAELFNRPLDRETLKQRELLRRLDVVGLRLGEAAAALADGALKRSR